MKRKLLLTSALIPAMLASGAMGQVVNFHDADNPYPITPAPNINVGGYYCELFAGQGAYSDPGNNVWNGFGDYGFGYQSTGFYEPGVWLPSPGDPGNPYAAFNGGGGWVTSTGSSLFTFTSGPTSSGNATSGGQWTPITLSVVSYGADTAIVPNLLPNGTPAFLYSAAAFNNGGSPNEVFTLNNVPAGAYGLYFYAANPDNNRGTAFSLNSGNAHNGIAATLNAGTGAPGQNFVEGQNFVIFENVTPDANGKITITASPNPQDGVGNSNGSGETDVNGFQLIFNPLPTAMGQTAAQNVYAGGTASFSFTPAFAPSPAFRWQSVISGVTNNLSDVGNISGSATTSLTIGNVSAANVGLYQCVITTATATNTVAAAPLTLLTSLATGPLQAGNPVTAVGNILQPGDILSDFNNNNGAPFNSVPPPWNMTFTNVEDGTLYQYVNFGGYGSSAPFSGPVGIVVTPNVGVSIATGMRLFAASSHPEDDPADYLLEGSTDGVNFTAIAGGRLSLPPQRNAAFGAINVTNQVLQEIDFANTAAYPTYRLTFTNVNNDTLASNGVQIAEVQLLGSLAPVPPGIFLQPPGSDVILAGTTFNAIVVADGAGPDTYQWYYNTTQKVPQGTNATLTLTNLLTSESGSYSCIVSNSYGSITTSVVNLTVVTPSAYEQKLLTFDPLAYWPLDETSGTIAYDNIGGYNGTYVNSPGTSTLGQPGVPTPGFGSPSYSVNFVGAYVDVPLGPFNITTPITIMAWAQQPGSSSFVDIFGHGDSSYRLSMNSGAPGFNDGGDSSGDATSPTSLNDNDWHFIVGVYTGGSGSTANGLLYVDGALVASNLIYGVAGSTYDLRISAAPDYTTRDFVGNICHAAVIPQALTQSQIQALYNSAGTAPVVTVTNTVFVDENGSGTIPAAVTGAAPIFYQWYYLNASSQTVKIPLATNTALQLSGVQTSWEAYQYYIVVSNASGAVTSSYVTLDVLSGPPQVLTDIFPSLVEVPVGIPVTFSVTADYTEPFSYQWMLGSSAISGATSSSYTFAALPGSNNYSVSITNIDSAGTPTMSSTAVVIGFTNAPPVVAFNGNGANWTLNQGSGWPGALTNPGIVNNVLTLTDGTNGETCSAFYNIPQYIGGFIASFTYTEAPGTSSPIADGSTFCVQNAPAGSNATGGGGGELGFYGIVPSAAFEMNVYPYAHGGVGIQFGVNGSTPDSANPTLPYASTSPVGLASGDPIYIQLYYLQNVATVWLVDSKTGNSFTTTYSVPDLPAIVGESSALVGFTGATGGDNSIQTVSDFTFSSTTAPILSVARGAAGSVVVSWPVSVSTLFVLQQSTPAVNGPWINVTAVSQVVKSMNQVTLTPGTSPVFYRLSLP